jgi:hypothetical protein
MGGARDTSEIPRVESFAGRASLGGKSWAWTLNVKTPQLKTLKLQTLNSQGIFIPQPLYICQPLSVLRMVIVLTALR